MTQLKIFEIFYSNFFGRNFRRLLLHNNSSHYSCCSSWSFVFFLTPCLHLFFNIFFILHTFFYLSSLQLQTYLYTSHLFSFPFLCMPYYYPILYFNIFSYMAFHYLYVYYTPNYYKHPCYLLPVYLRVNIHISDFYDCLNS